MILRAGLHASTETVMYIMLVWRKRNELKREKRLLKPVLTEILPSKLLIIIKLRRPLRLLINSNYGCRKHLNLIILYLQTEEKVKKILVKN